MNVTTLPRSGGRTTAGSKRANKATSAAVNAPTVGANALKLAPAVQTGSAQTGSAQTGLAQPKRRTAGAEQPRLRVAPPAPVRAPRAPFVALVLVIVIAGVIGILVLNTKIAENAFRLHDLRAEQVNLDLKQQRLERELARKESPGELAAQAARNGLVPSRTPAFIVLPDGQEVKMPGPGGSRD
jgi:hypothetical protein